MKIVIGRGNSRKVYELPHGSMFDRAAKSKDQEERKMCSDAITNICRILCIPGYND